MLLIYTEKISPRLQYVLDFIFNDIAKTEYTITSDLEYFTNYENIKINYSSKRICSYEYFLPSNTFIFENDLCLKKLNIFNFQNTKAIFPTHTEGDFSFDIFSAVFLMLSRFEEYQPYIKDAHGRFKPSESIAFKNNFLDKPVVNIWLKYFLSSLNKKFNINLPTQARKFKFINTIDIDIAFSYANKGLYRNLFGYLRDFKNFNFKDILLRTKVLGKLAHDPYDTYDYILKIHQKYMLNTIFFVHVGDYGLYDKNIPFKNNKFRDLIRHLSDYAEIGIHPSYESSTKNEKLHTEIERLSEIIKKDVTKSRQHFLRITLPHTYRNLIDAKIKEDYSLGFASEAGFRAGTCTPFKFFDLDANKTTSLTIKPFTIMDGTLKDYLNKSPDEAVAITTDLLNHTKNLNGEFIMLWHNESLSNKQRWEGWQYVYEKMINLALE